MSEKITQYGLRRTKDGELLGFMTTSNRDNDCCCDVTFGLCAHAGNLWLVSELEFAERARTTNTKWYNAEYNTPQHEYKPEALEVVKYEITVSKA